LSVALDCIRIASERWPGVASALELYKTLIAACMRIYDKDGDVVISAASPAETTGYESGRSRTTSPAAQPLAPAPPREQAPPLSSSLGADVKPPFGEIGPLSFSSDAQAPSGVQQSANVTQGPRSASQQLGTFTFPQPRASPQANGTFNAGPAGPQQAARQQAYFDHAYNPVSQIPLPATFPELVSWSPAFDFTSGSPPVNIPALSPYDPSSQQSDGGAFGSNAYPSNIPYSDYLYPPSWDMDRAGMGLNHQQQSELMESLQSTGTPVIERMITATNAVFYPSDRQY
jgi:hypothetical protein